MKEKTISPSNIWFPLHKLEDVQLCWIYYFFAHHSEQPSQLNYGLSGPRVHKMSQTSMKYEFKENVEVVRFHVTDYVLDDVFHYWPTISYLYIYAIQWVYSFSF